MRKLFTFLLAVAASVGMMNAKVTWDSSNISGFYVMGSNGSYSKEGVTLSANAEYVNAQWQSSTDDISFTTNETGGFTFSNTLDKNFTKIEMTLEYLGAWYSANLGSGWSSSDGDYLMNEPSTVTWTGNASTVDLLEDESNFDGKHVQSIVFYFEGDETDGPATYTLRLLADPEKGSVALQNPSSDIVLNYDGTYTVPENAEVTILATPLEGYEFSGWRVGNIYDMCYYDYCGGDALNTNDNPLTVTMTADVAYVADFAAAATPEPQPQPAQQVITWSAQSCHDVEAYYNMGQIITANNSKDGITVTYSGSDVNDLDGMRIGGIFLTGGTNSKVTFSSTVGDISKIEIYYYTNVLEDVPVGWTHEVLYDKFVWEGTPAASVDLMKGAERVGFYIRNIDFTIEAAEPAPEPVVNLKLIEFQVPASWENDNSPISIADFPDFVATTYEIASALPITSDEPSVVVFDFPGDDENSVYSKAGGQVSQPSTGTMLHEDFFEHQTQIHYYYPVLAGDEPEPQPQPAEDVEIIPNVDPENPTVYYSTFYDSEVKYLLPENVEAYVATLNGANLLLSKIADAGQTIPANNAVILKSTVTPFTLSISDAEAVPVNAINSLQGTDVSIATPANCYVLAGNDGVGFYHYTASMLNPHKAYVIYSGSQSSAPRRMPFVFEVATDVESIQPSAVSSQKVLRDGQLVIIRNGVEYNAAGQMVK